MLLLLTTSRFTELFGETAHCIAALAKPRHFVDEHESPRCIEREKFPRVVHPASRITPPVTLGQERFGFFLPIRYSFGRNALQVVEAPDLAANTDSSIPVFAAVVTTIPFVFGLFSSVRHSRYLSFVMRGKMPLACSNESLAPWSRTHSAEPEPR